MLDHLNAEGKSHK